MRALPLYLMPFPFTSSNSSYKATLNKISLTITLIHFQLEAVYYTVKTSATVS